MRQHGVDKWKIELYERFPCSNRTELRKKEGDIIKQIGTLSSIVSGRDKKEYSEANAEHLKERSRKYAEENKEKLKQRYEHYYQENKEKISERSKMRRETLTEEQREINRQRRKEYYDKHAEEDKERSKQYYQENKDKINERKRQMRKQKKETMGAATNKKEGDDELVEDIGRLDINQNETD
ncbi:hypothetical protein GUITHDRAFT_149306 [Guillardia theta CCMP2712]|uniref:Uncharacterized protein n=1 Tax=Guillardia theta (strain CCMP2712) TaxID=905079 RepID=L1I6D7_GUITC|nr:hypothetical protein GUITHDRAFT_149306 [Guillardia theta CCMP2712]EKX31430.1 hypothetical protein GUITHDRAFT_149306 [Guillardia theta CCMP2712]|eukprot:XP_005818410.1 hypothetical protein GUITHDRAFT_149306 [Guillardia theta CCMP2712]